MVSFPHMRRVFVFGVMIISSFVAAFPAAAFDVPAAVARATAFVVCDRRQGTGTMINATEGYVLTAGHIAQNSETGEIAGHCAVLFPNATPGSAPSYSASVVRTIYDIRTDRDFAILRLDERRSGTAPLPDALRTNEFAAPGDEMAVLGFPSGTPDSMSQSTGKVLRFSRGTVTSDAAISKGFSGGPAVDVAGSVIGVASRFSTETDDQTGVSTPRDYEFGDILSLISWLDESGPKTHDSFLFHADPARFDGAPYVIRDETLGCTHLVRTEQSPAVYCLLEGIERIAFPNTQVYFSWYDDFSTVVYATVEQLAQFRLVGTVTHKPGSLIKIQTDPRTYLVTDGFGTLRWIKTEERAKALFGDEWAKRIVDVSDASFAEYRLGPPIE